MAYGILRMEKFSTSDISRIAGHSLRLRKENGDLKTHSNKDIDVRRTDNNVYIINERNRKKMTAAEKDEFCKIFRVRDAIENRIRRAEKELQRQANDQSKRIRRRKDSVLFFEVVITSSSEWDADEKTKDAYYKKAVNYVCNKFGMDNMIYIARHDDEKVRHYHISFVPITEDYRLSAKDIFGTKKNMHQIQEEFYNEVCKQFNLQPFDNTGKPKKHLSLNDYKEKKAVEEELEKIQKQLKSMNEEYEAILERIRDAKDFKAIMDQIESYLENERILQKISEEERLLLLRFNDNVKKIYEEHNQCLSTQP